MYSVSSFSEMLKGKHDEMNVSNLFLKSCGRILKIQHPTSSFVLCVVEHRMQLRVNKYQVCLLFFVGPKHIIMNI